MTAGPDAMLKSKLNLNFVHIPPGSLQVEVVQRGDSYCESESDIGHVCDCDKTTCSWDKAIVVSWAFI